MRIDFEPVGRRVEVAPGTSLLDAARQAGIELVAVCGGGGTCGTCRVRLAAGMLSAVTADEQYILDAADREAGLRLACRAVPLSDVRIDIPPQSLTTPQRTQVEGIEAEVELDPPVVALDVTLEPPTGRDLRADLTRLRAVLEGQGFPQVEFPPAVLSDLSERLRAQDWSGRLALDCSVSPPRAAAFLPSGTPFFGLAVDLGTTKLAAYLVDLQTGQAAARQGAMNPQIAYGEDVVARIAYCNQHADGRRELQARLAVALSDLLTELCRQAGISPGQVVSASLVGNTAMHHLFAGLPVRQLGTAPYVPAASDALRLTAADVGLALPPAAPVYLPPNLAGYVGADHIAMLLATAADELPGVTVAMDIGTNTEITLSANGRLYACSCASGPAFEGAHIQAGMRAAPGAVERVQIHGGQVLWQTIGGQPPVGICGSGILDAVAQMLSAGILDARGVLLRDAPGVRPRGNRAEFVLVPAASSATGADIPVTRADVNQVQLAKAAIRAGVEVLLQVAGLEAGQIDHFIVAGAFGTYLDVSSALRTGLFPALPMQRFQQVGNAAGMGARQLLLSRAKRTAAEGLRERIQYVELTTYPGFTDLFVSAMFFAPPAG